MSKRSIGQIIAAHIESEGDRYDLSNSLSIRVLSADIAIKLQEAGYGDEGDS